MSNDLYLIGTISKSHGINGEVRVLPETSFIKRFNGLVYVFIGSNPSQTKRYSIEYVKIQGKWIILKLSGVSDCSAADALAGQRLYVTEDQVVELPKHTYFVHDVIGLSVFDEGGRHLGNIEDVMTLPANDVYVLRMEQREVLIPAIKSVVKEIDLKGRKMVIHALDGLLD
jgi:16S rRNA processing protein RimM